MMTKLDTHGWKEFRVGDLFDIHPTKHYNDAEGKALSNANLIESNGVNPVVVNSSYNNGIGGYTNKSCNEKGNIITFSDTTTADAVFYQPNPFVGYSHVQGMYPYSDKWSEKSLLYFLTVFKKIAVESGFDYANKFNRKIASEIMVLLPVKCSCTIDISTIMSTGGGIDMSKIDTSTWREFVCADLFDLLTVKNKLSKMDFSDNGQTPVYSSETNNSGILGYTNQQPDFIVDEDSPVYLVFGDHTKTMNIATESFCVMDNVKVLKPKIHNIEQLLFVIAVWKKAIPDLGYARHWSAAKEAKFKLPITQVEEIDFEYMETYMSNVESMVRDRISKLTSIKKVQNTAIDVYEWKKFHLYDIFEISMGNKFDRSKMQQTLPSVNFIGRSGVNNGVACKVDLVKNANGDIIDPYNAGDITIAMGGSIGSAFVQENDFYTSQNVCVLHTNNPQITFWAKQFIATAITVSCNNYEAFVDELNRHIKTDFTIYLPIIADGSPNYDYMDKYMRKVHGGGTQVLQALTDAIM